MGPVSNNLALHGDILHAVFPSSFSPKQLGDCLSYARMSLKATPDAVLIRTLSSREPAAVRWQADISSHGPIE